MLFILDEADIKRVDSDVLENYCFGEPYDIISLYPCEKSNIYHPLYTLLTRCSE